MLRAFRVLFLHCSTGRCHLCPGSLRLLHSICVCSCTICHHTPPAVPVSVRERAVA